MISFSANLKSSDLCQSNEQFQVFCCFCLGTFTWLASIKDENLSGVMTVSAWIITAISTLFFMASREIFLLKCKHQEHEFFCGGTHKPWLWQHPKWLCPRPLWSPRYHLVDLRVPVPYLAKPFVSLVLYICVKNSVCLLICSFLPFFLLFVYPLEPLPVSSVSIYDYKPSPETGVLFEIQYPEKYNVFTRVNISYWEGKDYRTMLYKGRRKLFH